MMKHDGSSVWGCMPADGVGYLSKIEGSLDDEMFCKILRNGLMYMVGFYVLENNYDIPARQHTSKMPKNIGKI